MKLIETTSFVIVLVVLAKADDRRGRFEAFKENIKVCVKETNATREDVRMMREQRITESRIAQCLAACVEKRSGILAADNTINMEKVKEVFENFKNLNEEIYNAMIKIYEDCKKQETKETDECEAAKKLCECVGPKIRELRPRRRPRPE